MSGAPVVVIGAGFGGLALAIRLQSAGVRTLVLEKRDLPGGRAYAWHDQGFTFDAGPTVITAPNAIEELFTLSGRNIRDYAELLPVDPYYRLSWESGFELEYNGDFDFVAEQLRVLTGRPPVPLGAALRCLARSARPQRPGLAHGGRA